MTGVRARKSKRARKINTTRSKRKTVKKTTVADTTVRRHWDDKKTLKENFKSLGLAYDSNTAVKLKKQKPDESATMEVDKSVTTTPAVAELQQQASNAKKTERHISSGEADFLTGMLNDHGDDYKAMARDKRNIYQHTPNQLKRKCEAYMKSPYFEKYQTAQMEIDA